MNSEKIFFGAVIGVILFGFLLVGLFSLTVRKPQPELCNNVTLSLNKDECFHTVAVETGKAEYCSKIAQDETRDLCFIDLAQGNTYMSAPKDVWID